MFFMVTISSAKEELLVQTNLYFKLDQFALSAVILTSSITTNNPSITFFIKNGKLTKLQITFQNLPVVLLNLNFLFL